MVALYRSGRHADALEVYRRGRQVLNEELGLEPSPFLAQLERQILSHDPTLIAPVRRVLPVGTVTFLFTDIEGSTRLIKQLGERYGEVLAEHERILRDAAERCEGREVDNQGDSFFFAFASAKSALAAAVIAQRELAEHQWPDGSRVRVRMGLHSGEPAVGEERYIGLAVHRAARIGAAGHGGQVLPSNATRELVEDEVGGVTVRELGTYRLKDIDRPEPLYQLDIDGLETEFPPLKAERFVAPNPGRRRRRVVGAVSVALAVVAAAIFLIVSGGSGRPQPNSVLRIDPKTLEATQVAQVGDAPDLIIASGGYLWVTNNILRDSAESDIVEAGDHTLIRVDPAAGTAVPVGGISPCGLAADPSGDVWVANCFPEGNGQSSNVVRVDAGSLHFEQMLQVPGGHFYYRGIAYGGGSLWLSDPDHSGVFQVDPRTGERNPIRLPGAPGSLAWSGGYGDLWITAFDDGSITRLHAANGRLDTTDLIATNPGSVVVEGSDRLGRGLVGAPRRASRRGRGDLALARSPFLCSTQGVRDSPASGGSPRAQASSGRRRRKMTRSGASIRTRMPSRVSPSRTRRPG